MGAKIFLILISALLPTAAPSRIRKEIVSVVYHEEVPGVITYDGKIPVTWKLELPSVAKLTGNIPRCKREYSLFLCDLGDHPVETFNTMIGETLNGYPFLRRPDSSKSTRGLLNFMGERFKFLFGLETESHGDAIRGNIKFMNAKQRFLDAETKADHDALVRIIHSASSYSSAMQKAMNNFSSNVAKKMHDALTVVNNKETSMTYALSVVYHLSQLTNAIMFMETPSVECREGLIPISSIGEPRFVSEISLLNKQLSKKGLKIAGPPQALLDKKLAKCLFAGGDAYISVSIPVKRVNSKYKIFRLTPIHFKFQQEVCRVKDIPRYVFDDGGQAMQISAEFHETCYVSTHMCHKPNTDINNKFRTCTQALLERDLHEIGKACPLECIASKDKFKAWIGENQLVLTNYDIVRVTCDNGEVLSTSVDAAVGAVTITVPCGCSVGADTELIQPIFPCFTNDNSTLQHPYLRFTIPSTFAKLDSLELLSAGNLTDEKTLDFDWKLKLPYIDGTPPVQVKYKDFTGEIPFIGTVTIDENWMIMWLMFLSAAIIWMFIAPYITGCCNGSGLSHPAKYIPFFTVPGAHAAGTDDATPWYFNVWSLILKLEYVEITGYVILILLLFVILRISFKMHQFIRKLAQLGISMESFDEESYNTTGRRGRGK